MNDVFEGVFEISEDIDVMFFTGLHQREKNTARPERLAHYCETTSSYDQ